MRPERFQDLFEKYLTFFVVNSKRNFTCLLAARLVSCPHSMLPSCKMGLFVLGQQQPLLSELGGDG